VISGNDLSASGCAAGKGRPGLTECSLGMEDQQAAQAFLRKFDFRTLTKQNIDKYDIMWHIALTWQR
jgi:hypothetical protein